MADDSRVSEVGRDSIADNAVIVSNMEINNGTNANVEDDASENAAVNIEIGLKPTEDDISLDANTKQNDLIFNEIDCKMSEEGSNVSVLKVCTTANADILEFFEETNETEPNYSIEAYKSQVESLEKLLNEQKQENELLKERVRQQGDRLSESDKINREMEMRMDTLKKKVDESVREKNATVMRYAVSEKAVIEVRSTRDSALKNEKQAKAEVDLLNTKLRSAHAERARICGLLDEKVHELSQSQKEAQQLKRDFMNSETKLKWTQNKLRNEMDAYRDANAQTEKLQQQLATLQAEKDQFQTNLQDSTKSKELEVQLREVQALLILQRHEKEKAEMRCKQANSISDAAKAEVAVVKEEVERLNTRVETLLLENNELESRASEVTTLMSRAAHCDTLSIQLQREKDRASSLEDESSRLRISTSKALEKAEQACRREAEALGHLEKVTSDNVEARTKCSTMESKLSELLPKHSAMSSELESVRTHAGTLSARLDEESSARRRDSELLARRVAELTKESEDLKKQLDWQVGENALMRKKNTNVVKELMKELQRSIKKCEALEAKLPQHGHLATATENGTAKRGSNSSLSSFESVTTGGAGTNTTEGQSSTIEANERLQGDIPIHDQVREPTMQQLIERVVALQRSLARRSERVDFLEEHVKQLTSELRTKSKMVRTLALKCPTGAIADSLSDQNKAEFARRGGGVMAAVYGAEPDSDSGMTLALSLEMNRKLQAVLEDALLKNMTLEENIETLGNEIARLLSARKT